MDFKRQKKLLICFFILVSIFISIALFSYCSGGACSSFTEETAASSEEYNESDAEEDNDSSDRRVPSSDNEQNASESNEINSNQ